jgi:hypothetical protein
MALSTAVRIDAPPVVPARGGFLAAATVHPEWEAHYGFGIEYQSWLCGTGNVVAAPCGVLVPGLVTDTPPKETSGSAVATGFPFAAYAGVQCDLIGGPYTAQAKSKLAGSEDYLVSKAFYEIAILGAAYGTPKQTANALPSTANPLDLAEIIGELEEYAALTYAGTPILHMNRRVAAVAYAGRSLISDPLTGALFTAQGTPVANAAGYPDEIVFITGQVNLWRGPVNTFDVPAVMQNQSIALAEALYVVSTECLLAYAGTIGPAPLPSTYVS